MSANDFESLAMAKMFKAWITTEVAAQVQKIAPRRRVAEVTAIDLETRRAGVIYVGETNEVSLPFNLAVPAFVGQYVIVDGPPQDRSIVDVLGESGIEQKVQQNLADTPLPAYWEAPQIDALETFPTRLRPTASGDEFIIPTGRMAFIPLRVRTDSVFSQIATQLVTVGGATNRIILSAYSIRSDGTYSLVAQTPEIAPGSGPMVGILDTELSVQRGDMLAIGIHVSGSGDRPGIMALRHTVSPLPFGLDYTSAVLDVSSVPPSLTTEQLSFAYVVTPWAALIR